MAHVQAFLALYKPSRARNGSDTQAGQTACSPLPIPGIRASLKKVFMNFALKPLNSLIFAGLLASVGAHALAQNAPAAPSAAASASMDHNGGHRMMGQRDPAKMQAWIAKRQAELKIKLDITPAQEGAWTSFTAAMQPPAHHARPTAEQRAEFDKLTTPERIDKTQAMRSQRQAEMTAAMNKRGEATKAFYAALNPAQQKTFDEEHKRLSERAVHGHHEGGTDRKG
jgi:periplasmic protein CpxP/Spy